MDETFSLKIEDFEGPLDLLLALIEKKKLHISKVAIAQVADDYVNYLSRHNELPKHEAADFLVIASTLMLIKSASLLPTLTLTPEEEASADELERRLKLYEYLKNVSLDLKKLYGTRQIFFREQSRERAPVFTSSKEITLSGLYAAMQGLLSSIPKVEILPEVVVKKVMTLGEAMEKLSDRIQSALSLKFSDFAPRDKYEKVSLIVSFLGMLELVKQGMIDVEQSAHFDDITMQTTQAGLPRY